MRANLIICLNKIKNNIQEIKKITSKEIMCVIKSNAYGLGLVKIAKVLEKQKIKYLVVATINEGITLRKNNIKCQILILEYSHDFLSYLKYNLIYCAYDLESLNKLIKSKYPIRIHLKFNTGLNRLGIEETELENLVDIIRNNRLKIEGIFTHIASNDTYEQQLKIFDFFREKLSFIPNLLIHIDSSRFILKNNFSNAIRIGLSLYTFKETPIKLTSNIIKIKSVNKDQLVGYDPQEKVPCKGYILTIPFGYKDNIIASKKMIGFVDNNKVQQIGKSCMDHSMFFSKNKIKSPTIELIGDHLSLDYLSNLYQVSIYQILSTLSSRLDRYYID